MNAQQKNTWGLISVYVLLFFNCYTCTPSALLSVRLAFDSHHLHPCTYFNALLISKENHQNFIF